MNLEKFSVGKFFTEHRQSLELILVAGENGLEKILESRDVQRPSMALMGWLSGFAHQRVQILGRTEMSYLQNLGREALTNVLEKIFAFDVPCVIVSKGIVIPPTMIQLADKTATPVFSSKLATVDVISKLANILDDVFAPKIYLHGTMMDVYGVGMIYTGKSGIGKSECALDLVERGHRLIADDVVEVKKHSDNVLIASGNQLLGHHMEIRGVGIIDIERLFGVRAVRMQKRVELEVRLVMWEEIVEYERVGIENEYTTILGVQIPVVTIPVSPGKNLTAISEVIAMNHMLKVYGENTAKNFIERLNEEMRRRSVAREYLKKDIE